MGLILKAWSLVERKKSKEKETNPTVGLILKAWLLVERKKLKEMEIHPHHGINSEGMIISRL